MGAGPVALPRWVDSVALPLLNLMLALLAAGAVVLAAGGDPAAALAALVAGSLGSADAVGYTLHHATNMAFTGLTAAVAFQGGLFNIGAEGQAYLAVKARRRHRRERVTAREG